MKNTEFLKACGDIDDRYILEAAPTAHQAKQPRKQLLMTLAFVALAVFALILPKHNNTVTDANPFTVCASQAEAEEKAGFTINIPELNEGTWTYYSDGMIEFANSDITIRKATGSEDVSGDYNDYETVQTIQVNDAEVTIRQNGTKVYGAIWQSAQYSYAISWTDGTSETDAINVIKQVK